MKKKKDVLTEKMLDDEEILFLFNKKKKLGLSDEEAMSQISSELRTIRRYNQRNKEE